MKRLVWHSRWVVRSTPIVLDPWVDDLRIALPRTGSAARVYYFGHIDRALASEIRSAVPRGGTYVDIGAHIGELTLLGARAAGSQGVVLALEPNRELAEIVRLNAELNGLHNVRVRDVAVGARPSRIRFAVDERTGGGWIASSTDTGYQVECVTLDTIASDEGLERIDVLKLDAAGAELDVLLGSKRLLEEERLPCVIVKLYNPAVVLERFGYDALMLVDELLEQGYVLDALVEGERPNISSVEDAGRIVAGTYGIILVGRRG